MSLAVVPLDHAHAAVASEIHRVLQAGYTVEARILSVEDFLPLRRTAAQIRRAASSFLGAYHGARLAAVTELEIHPGSTVNIAALVVHPEQFRRGFGSALLSEIVGTHGNCDITVSTGVRNGPARALYTAQGFRELRRWVTEDGIAMLTLLREAL